MKAIIVSAALIAACNPVAAQSVEALETCRGIGGLAASIMSVRQSGASRSDFMLYAAETFDSEMLGLVQAITADAFALDIAFGEAAKEHMVSSFRDQIESICLEKLQ